MNKNLQEPQSSEEVDLGQLFKLIGNAFNRLFEFIGSILNSLFLAFVWLVFFTKKHIFKIVIAGVLGIASGIIKQKTAEPIYKTSIIVKQNYNTGENLYEAIEYYNRLVEERDTATISRVLNIDLVKSGKIEGFEAEAVTTENTRIENYDKYIKNLDSVVA